MVAAQGVFLSSFDGAPCNHEKRSLNVFCHSGKARVRLSGLLHASVQGAETRSGYVFYTRQRPVLYSFAFQSKTCCSGCNPLVTRNPLRQKLRKELALPLLLAFASLLLFSNLGASRDFVRAESYFAMGAQLMVQTNDWLSPHAPDEPVLNKPPLQYWLTGIGYRLFGASYTTARLPSAFAALCLLMLVYLLCSRLYEKRAALLAVGCLMTSYLFFIFSRTAMSDMLFTMCVSASLSCFILIMTEKSARVEKPAALCGYLFLALGVLAKGPLAVVLVAGPLAIELIISRDFSMLKRLRIFSGTLVFLTVAAPYFLLLYLKMGGRAAALLFYRREPAKIHGRNLHVCQCAFLASPACLPE